MATKYSCDIHTENGWESIALFADTTSFGAMEAFITAEFQCGNSLANPCDAIRIIDLDTGEIIADIDLQTLLEDGAHIVNDEVMYPPEPDWIDDDCGFDPYAGCFTYDC